MPAWPLRCLRKLYLQSNRLACLPADLCTEGCVSDLRELCRAGSMRRVREMAAEEEELRAVSMEDMLAALAKMRESRLEVGCYHYTNAPLHRCTTAPLHHYTIHSCLVWI